MYVCVQTFSMKLYKGIQIFSCDKIFLRNRLPEPLTINSRLFFLGMFFFLAFTYCKAQDRQTDSLKTVLVSLKEDSTKVNTLLKLTKAYFNLNSPLALNTSLQARALSEKINYPKGIANATKFVGNSSYRQGNYIEALEYWNRAMAIFDSIGDKQGVANILSNLGVVYNIQHLNEKALESLLKALKIGEQLADSVRIASTSVNIGDIYIDKKATYDKALEFYMRALPVSERLRDTNLIASAIIGIGETYIKKEKDIPALYYLKKALAIVNGKEPETYVLNDIGDAYTLRKDFKSAIIYHQRSLELSKKQDVRRDMMKAYLGLGRAYEGLGNYQSAVDNFKEAQKIGEELKAQIDLSLIYKGLSESFSGLHDYNQAFQYQELLTSIKDSIYNFESEKKLGAMQFDFDLAKKQGQLDLKELDLKKEKVIKNITIGGLAIVMLFFVVVFLQKKRITKEKKRSDELLLNILPEETAEELKATGTAKTKSFDLVSVLFTDFKNFTQASEKLTPEELVQEINHCYCEFDRIITKYNIEKIKTIGDAYMCAGGLPASNTTHPVDVVKAGLEMQEFIAQNKTDREEKGLPFFELRLGIHTGPVVAGIVGIKKFAYDIWGDTVNTASRMESSGEIGKVNISGTTYEMIKDKFSCTHRGKVKAKNKGEIDMYFVEKIL